MFKIKRNRLIIFIFLLSLNFNLKIFLQDVSRLRSDDREYVKKNYEKLLCLDCSAKFTYHLELKVHKVLAHSKSGEYVVVKPGDGIYKYHVERGCLGKLG